MSQNKQWIKQHCADPYVKRAQQDGYPSRAAYKLLELQQKYQLIKSGMRVVDLGSTPGGWSMVAAKLVGERGQVFALDCLLMSSIAGVEFIQGDFTEQAVLDQLLAALGEQSVDVVLSDMAPNLSGDKCTDQARSVHLVELAWDCARQVLCKNGAFIAKIFQGAGVDELIKSLKSDFKQVNRVKPKASRPRSREFYLVATRFLKPN